MMEKWIKGQKEEGIEETKTKIRRMKLKKNMLIWL